MNTRLPPERAFDTAWLEYITALPVEDREELRIALELVDTDECAASDLPEAVNT